MQLPYRSKLEQMIESAMKSKAPKMYQELVTDGNLSKVIQDRANEAEETYDWMTDEGKSKILSNESLSHQEVVQALTANNSQACEAALIQALEFPVEDEE